MARTVLIFFINACFVFQANARINSTAFVWAGPTQHISKSEIIINDRRFKSENIKTITLKNDQTILLKNIKVGMIFGVTMDMNNKNIFLWEIESNQIPDYLR